MKLRMFLLARFAVKRMRQLDMNRHDVHYLTITYSKIAFEE